jgi:FixJ family two-component response regulator
MSQLPRLIAILDDEAEMRKALRRLLLTRGFRVEVHERAEELLASLSTEQPDCIVLDLHMTGVTGFEVLTTLASSHSPPRVVVITGHDEPGTEERVRRLGAVAYLRKPMDEAALFSAIEMAIEQAQPKVTHFQIGDITRNRTAV